MLFNSYVFPVFFLAVYAAYVLLRRRWRWQNRLLLVASYVFYGYWDWRFLSLLALSTIIDYNVGRWLGQTEQPRRRRWLLAASVVSNLGILATFKYFNFFAESFAQCLAAVGFAADYATLNIVLPVGISFYTFQTLSYTIDVYRRKLEPCRRLENLALFVAFFPQLVAGPIERAGRLLPQITQPRRVTATRIDAGLALIIWGYFKKVVVADNIAVVADAVFNNYHDHAGLDLVIGALAFTVQIYGDFSGYSDIARGTAKLLGFDLCLNFRLPYFAVSPSDFWRRWHISLSSWLRDYLYIPLGGNRGGRLRTARNLMLTMMLGGLWHGAAWNFVLWGVYHGAILVIYRAAGDGRRSWQPDVQSPFAWQRLPAMVLMFVLTVFGWVLFRSSSAAQIAHFVTHAGFGASAQSAALAFDLAYFATPLLLVQIFQQATRRLTWLAGWPVVPRAVAYAVLLGAIAVFGVRDQVEFIYFQF